MRRRNPPLQFPTVAVYPTADQNVCFFFNTRLACYHLLGDFPDMATFLCLPDQWRVLRETQGDKLHAKTHGQRLLPALLLASKRALAQRLQHRLHARREGLPLLVSSEVYTSVHVSLSLATRSITLPRLGRDC